MSSRKKLTGNRPAPEAKSVNQDRLLYQALNWVLDDHQLFADFLQHGNGNWIPKS